MRAIFKCCMDEETTVITQQKQYFVCYIIPRRVGANEPISVRLLNKAREYSYIFSSDLDSYYNTLLKNYISFLMSRASGEGKGYYLFCNERVTD